MTGRKPTKHSDEVVAEEPTQGAVSVLQDLLFIQRGKWAYKGRQLTDKERDNLKAECDVIARTALWKIMVAEGKYHAQKRAMIDANTGDEARDMTTLRSAQAYHEVVVFFEKFISNIKNR